jgi:hypothetical protein
MKRGQADIAEAFRAAFDLGLALSIQLRQI